MVQEHRLCQARWIATLPALMRSGRGAPAGVLGLAAVSSHGKRLGGTAVLVRSGLPAPLAPLGVPEAPLQGRLTRVRLESRGCELAIASAYFHTAGALGSRSRAMLADCLHNLAALGPGGLATLLGTLFLAGLAGGVTHCASMCGPFVLAQSAALADRNAGGPLLRRLAGAASVSPMTWLTVRRRSLGTQP